MLDKTGSRKFLTELLVESVKGVDLILVVDRDLKGIEETLVVRLVFSAELEECSKDILGGRKVGNLQQASALCLENTDRVKKILLVLCERLDGLCKQSCVFLNEGLVQEEFVPFKVLLGRLLIV